MYGWGKDVVANLGEPGTVMVALSAHWREKILVLFTQLVKS